MSKKTIVSKRSAKSTSAFLDRYSHLFTIERTIIGGTILFILGIMGVLAFNSWQSRIVYVDGVERIFVQGGTSGNSQLP